MRVVDAHQHYWILERGDYGWLTPQHEALYRDFTPEHLQPTLAACSVARTMVVQAAATEEESQYLIQLTREHETMAGVVGWVDFEAQDVEARVHALASGSGGLLKGVRPMVQDIADANWLARESLDRAFDSLVEHDLTFDALVRPKHFDVLTQRLRAHRELRCVLDHAGKPDIARGCFDTWAAGLQQLASFNSLHCKLSGLLTEAHAGCGPEQLDRYVAHIFSCFGPERVMWGSDWPVVTLQASYAQWLQMARELVRRHAPGHEKAVFARNAIRFYRLRDGRGSQRRTNQV